MEEGKITRISGPVVYAKIKGSMNDVVKIGQQGLLGEIIEIRENEKVIQVYEETTGLKPDEKVINTKKPLSVTLAPGIMGKVFDGTQRPLNDIKKTKGIFLGVGSNQNSLDENKKWDFKPLKKKGDTVKAGQVLGQVQENSLITHKILVPNHINGTIDSINKGEHTINETIATINGEKITMKQEWPVRKPRPTKEGLRIKKPLITGQRILDVLFPLPKGGLAAIPGPFGSGKTVTQQSIAKFSDADVIVYIGCGERGNEMTDVLEEFPHLKDPRTNEPLMNRTILIANTSNMPVAAREASIYTGITIAEYFRDQGLDVALMADSTSRWAEAMREISGRLEEMPGEEGYPAYLSKRLASFYERAGLYKTLNDEEGSISVIGAVSPPGGDFSEPVTQNTLRITQAFWALQSELADKRHYPAISWLQSYSLYSKTVTNWYDENVENLWSHYRKEIIEILQEEEEIQEIVQLVGPDSLPKHQKILLLISKVIREDFLQQNAFTKTDQYCPTTKQYEMLKNIVQTNEKIKKNTNEIDVTKLVKTNIFSLLAEMKDTSKEVITSKKYKENFKKTLNKSVEEAKSN